LETNDGFDALISDFGMSRVLNREQEEAYISNAVVRKANKHKHKHKHKHITKQTINNKTKQ